MTAPRPAPGFATAEEALDAIERRLLGIHDDPSTRAPFAVVRSELASLREMVARARAAEERMRAELNGPPMTREERLRAAIERTGR